MARKRIVEKESNPTMKKCKTVKAILDETIARLSLEEQRELSEFVKERENLLRAKGEELSPAARHSLIVSWFVRKGKKLR